MVLTELQNDECETLLNSSLKGSQDRFFYCNMSLEVQLTLKFLKKQKRKKEGKKSEMIRFKG